jgi:hypothetical protein
MDLENPKGMTCQGELMAENPEPRKIAVVAFSGYKACERPLYLMVDGDRLKVSEVLDRWYGESDDFFKVLMDGGRAFLVKRNRIRDEWFLLKQL